MSSKRFCSKCGKEIAAETRFCQFCGEPCASTMQTVTPKVTAHNGDQKLIGLAKIKKCFFSTEGRLNRKRFFIRSISMFTTYLLVTAIIWVLINITGSIELLLGMPVILTLMCIPMAYAGITLQIRRAHDLNKEGTYVLWTFIPIVGIYFGCILLFKKGTEGSNKFGPDPLMLK